MRPHGALHPAAAIGRLDLEFSYAARAVTRFLDRGHRPVEVHVPPLAFRTLPNSALFEAARYRSAVAADALVEPNIGHHRHVTHEPDMGRADGRLRRRALPAQLKIEVME